MKTNVLGIEIDSDKKEVVLEGIKNRLNDGRSIFIVTPYSEMIVAAQKDEELKNVLNSADFSLPDGAGVLWAAHYLSLFPSRGLGRDQGRGRTIVKTWYLISSLIAIIFNPKSLRDPIPEKISGSDFVWDLARLAAERGLSIFLLGGFADTARLAAEKLKSRFPNLEIAGTTSPVILPGLAEASRGERHSEGSRDSSSAIAIGTQNDKIINEINNSRADFLFVALGPVRQEKWIHENLPKLNAKLAIGLGGTFDYLAQKRPLAPRFWASGGLEWLWRLLTQPWRLKRIFRGVFGLIYYCFRAR